MLGLPSGQQGPVVSGESSNPPSLEPLALRVRLARMLEFRPREAAALAVLAALVVAGAGFAFLKTLPRPAQAIRSPAPELSPLESVSPTAGGQVVVDVAGAVRHPGVYTFGPGSRVVDAIKAGGGAAPGGDVDSINLARPLVDGERIYVPRKGETLPPEAGSGDPGGAGGKTNINTASASQLEELPGIGPALAQRIVEYRTQHGPFRSIQDLQKVPGIGPKKFDALKDHVTV